MGLFSHLHIHNIILQTFSVLCILNTNTYHFIWEATMSFSAKNYDFKGETCIELIAGDFRALIAPFNGSNVMKL